MTQKEIVETMFENLHNAEGTDVEYKIWWDENLMTVKGTLSEVTDYDKICVKGINIPFIDLGKAIFYVKGENGMLYLNPMMKDKYENKPYYFVNEYRRVFFGEEKQIDELSR